MFMIKIRNIDPQKRKNINSPTSVSLFMYILSDSSYAHICKYFKQNKIMHTVLPSVFSQYYKYFLPIFNMRVFH